jgi:hypothetical protein
VVHSERDLFSRKGGIGLAMAGRAGWAGLRTCWRMDLIRYPRQGYLYTVPSDACAVCGEVQLHTAA